MEARLYYDLANDREAAVAYSKLLASDSTNVEALGRLGAIAVRAGDAATARQMDERLKRVNKPYLMGANHRWRAVIAAAEGKPADATALIDMAVRNGHRLMDTPPNLTAHVDRDLVALEKTPAWKSMLEGLSDASAVKMTVR
jgi:hypothetical protein